MVVGRHQWRFPCWGLDRQSSRPRSRAQWFVWIRGPG